jgi:hypothetical protein
LFVKFGRFVIKEFGVYKNLTLLKLESRNFCLLYLLKS